MTHIAIQEAFDGKVVDWMEKVSDEQVILATDYRSHRVTESMGTHAPEPGLMRQNQNARHQDGSVFRPHGRSC
jgi:hypothetical protein